MDDQMTCKDFLDHWQSNYHNIFLIPDDLRRFANYLEGYFDAKGTLEKYEDRIKTIRSAALLIQDIQKQAYNS